MAEKTSKNVWIIPPKSTGQIVLEGIDDNEIDAKAEGSGSIDAGKLQEMGFGPHVKCNKISQCDSVKITCTNLLIRPCEALVYCGTVSCTGVTVTP